MELINKRNMRFFSYILIDIIILFAVNFYYLHLSQIFLYMILIVLSSFLILFTKNFIAGLFHIGVNGEFWLTGMIFFGNSHISRIKFRHTCPDTGYKL